jgi:hypothetical protein
MWRRRSDSGVSTVELLAAMLLTLVVIGAVVGVVGPHAMGARLQPDAVDAQQRLRTAVDVLSRALYEAGAGVDAGTLAGPLVRFLPPVIPRRIGRTFQDPPAISRQDALTIIHASGSASQSALAVPFAGATATLLALPGCPLTRPACALDPDDGLVIFDDESHFDLFTVVTTAGMSADVRHRGRQGAYPFPAGSHAAEAELRVYYFDAAQQQIRASDGDLTDQPLVDGIAQMSVEYVGSPLPPRFPKPPPGIANCLYDAFGAPNPALVVLPASAGGLAPLPLSLMSDGPWCGAGDTRFDADVLRIRRIRMTLTVAAGRSRRHPSVTFDIAPRNLVDQP